MRKCDEDNPFTYLKNQQTVIIISEHCPVRPSVYSVLFSWGHPPPVSFTLLNAIIILSSLSSCRPPHLSCASLLVIYLSPSDPIKGFRFESVLAQKKL